ncbi:tigger transposable element-derived protein 1-like [Octopus sinensis]|uniref:Tigger transposable element-derived protein 1-like n=1 Tax=Octopus sinensis TaxID=2607531 RepID=A0A6P7TZA5_9MOLL|nr:tigger transposable element-derived protein 1-like [Octopus sinensis]
MREKRRKIALLIDNATCHAVSLKLSNVDVIFFPKNTSSLIQPCDQGIIKAFKNHYNNWIMKTIIYDKNPAGKIDEAIKGITILDAISCSKLAWDEITDTSIQHCFEKALEYDCREKQDIEESLINSDIVENAILKSF